MPKTKNGWLLSKSEKAVLHCILTKAVKQRRLAELEQNPKLLTKHTTVRTHMKRMGIMTKGLEQADVVWGWVATEQDDGRLLGLERRVNGAAGAPRPSWRETAKAKGGWDAKLRAAFTENDLFWVETVQRVLAHARRAAAGNRGIGPWTEDEEEEVPMLTKMTLRETQQSTKSFVKGATMTTALAILGKMGLLGGYLGKGAALGSSTQEADLVVSGWQKNGAWQLVPKPRLQIWDEWAPEDIEQEPAPALEHLDSQAEPAAPTWDEWAPEDIEQEPEPALEHLGSQAEPAAPTPKRNKKAPKQKGRRAHRKEEGGQTASTAYAGYPKKRATADWRPGVAMDRA